MCSIFPLGKGIDISGRTHRTQHKVIIMAKTHYSERIQSKIRKDKKYGTKSGGNQVEASKGLLPAETIGHLIPPAASCANACEVLSIREPHQRSSSQDFHWGPVTQAPSILHTPMFQTPRRRAGAQHQTHHLHKQSRPSKPSPSVLRMVRTLLKSKLPDTSHWPTLQEGHPNVAPGLLANSLLH